MSKQTRPDASDQERAEVQILGKVTVVTRGPYGMIYEIPNPTPFRNP